MIDENAKQTIITLTEIILEEKKTREGVEVDLENARQRLSEILESHRELDNVLNIRNAKLHKALNKIMSKSAELEQTKIERNIYKKQSEDFAAILAPVLAALPKGSAEALRTGKMKVVSCSLTPE